MRRASQLVPAALAILALLFTSAAWAEKSAPHAAPAGAEQGAHGEAHGDDHGPGPINWFYGMLAETDTQEPNLLFRPKGMQPPLGAMLLNTAILFYVVYRAGRQFQHIEFPVAVAAAAEGQARPVGTPRRVAIVGGVIGQAQRLGFADLQRPQVGLAAGAQRIHHAAASAQRVGDGRLSRDRRRKDRRRNWRVLTRLRPRARHPDRQLRLVLTAGLPHDHDQQRDQQQHGEGAQRAVLGAQRVLGHRWA